MMAQGDLNTGHWGEPVYNEANDDYETPWVANATTTTTTPTTTQYNAPPGEGPNQQDPANTVMTPQVPSKIADPNWTAKPFNIMDASTWIQSAPMIDNPDALPAGSVGSDVNTDGTPRDSVATVTANTEAALIPQAPTTPTTPTTPTDGPVGTTTTNSVETPPPRESPKMGELPTYTNPEYNRQGSAMQSAAEASYGANATETMQNAMRSGADFGNMAAAEGGRNATGYARASGLSPAQAALMAGQGAEGAYNTGLGQGVDRYMGAARDMGSLGTSQESLGLQKYGTDVGSATSRYGTDTSSTLQKYGLDLGKYATDVGDATQRYGIDKGVDSQNTSNWMNMLGAGASALAPLLFSDKNLKTDIRDGYGLLASVTKEVGPKAFKYKGSSSPEVGVMAQDLEKTPLKSAVVNTPNGKMVDTRKLTTGNTAMISELSQKLDKVFDYLKAAK